MRKKRSILPFGRTVSHRRVDEHGAEAHADGGELGRRVVRAVVDINGLGHAALVDGGLEAIDEVGRAIVGVEGAVGHHARRIVDETDEEGFDGLAGNANEGAVEGVGLPHVIGMGLGEGEARLG